MFKTALKHVKPTETIGQIISKRNQQLLINKANVVDVVLCTFKKN